MDANTICGQLFFLTAHLEAVTASATWSGTGFMYGVQTQHGVSRYLVTNRHVLEGADAIRLTMIAEDQGAVPALGKAARAHIPLSLGSWNPHPDPDVDVAVLPVDSVFRSMTAGSRSTCDGRGDAAT